MFTKAYGDKGPQDGQHNDTQQNYIRQNIE
jgi:hypothetical protein